MRAKEVAAIGAALAAALAVAAACTVAQVHGFPSLLKCSTAQNWVPFGEFNEMRVKAYSHPPSTSCVLQGVPTHFVPCQTYTITLTMGENLAYKLAASGGTIAGKDATVDERGCVYRNSKSTGASQLTWTAPPADPKYKRVAFHAVCGQFDGPVYAVQMDSISSVSSSAEHESESESKEAELGASLRGGPAFSSTC